jgi:hypothetical protein
MKYLERQKQGLKWDVKIERSDSGGYFSEPQYVERYSSQESHGVVIEYPGYWTEGGYIERMQHHRLILI